MQTVQAIARAIVAREGGFVNDPDDPGGATNFGVTIGTMRSLGLDLDGDGDIDLADVHAMTEAQAAELFIENYFKKTNIDLLPVPMQATVFDMNVNAGNRSIKILQELLCVQGESVAIDGALGPKTAAAVHRVFELKGLDLVDAYGLLRRDYYYRLADHRPALRKFARRRDGGKGGWIRRAEEFISSRFHLTAAQHRARVRAWV